MWKRHLLDDFGANLPTWGMCSTPLVVDDKLIVESSTRGMSMPELAAKMTEDYMGNLKAIPPGEAYPKAKTAALQGLAIDEQAAELHTSLGGLARLGV